MKKRIGIAAMILAIIGIIWGGISLYWWQRKSQQYDGFINAIVSSADATGYDKKHYKFMGYDYCDSDGYTYSIKQPGYLSLVGNLSVTAPIDKGDPDTLIIWVEGWFKTEYSYGVLLYDDDAKTSYQILIDGQGNVIDSEDQSIVDAHRERVDILLKKANQMWTFPE